MPNTNQPTNDTPINVTKTYLPPLEEYVQYLQRIWETNQLTNNGSLVQELEAKLRDYLAVNHLFLVGNGTIALQIAIKALGLQGEIITTPFSYVATTSSIVWEGCQPVFADIDPATLCIDADEIEKAITPRTSAILAVHVYGNPCNVERIQEIADRHRLKVIYDAAHTFGARYKGIPLANFGDVSTLSFHATKLFHTGEGGAIVTNSENDAFALEYMRRFGHKTPTEFWGVGINGKNSELHAAMGLCVLPRVDGLIQLRRAVSDAYDTLLSKLFDSEKIRKPMLADGALPNFGYYPIIFSSERDLIQATNALNANEIYPRRYFYPSLNTLSYVKYRSTPQSESISPRILCLPMSHDLTNDQLAHVCDIIEKHI